MRPMQPGSENTKPTKRLRGTTVLLIAAVAYVAQLGVDTLLSTPCLDVTLGTAHYKASYSPSRFRYVPALGLVFWINPEPVVLTITDTKSGVTHVEIRDQLYEFSERHPELTDVVR